MQKLTSIKALLQGLTGVMALALVVLFATSAERAYTGRLAAERGQAVIEISRNLFTAMQTIRLERGTVSSALLATTPIDQGTQRDIAALRAKSGSVLDAARAEIGKMGIPASDVGLAKIADAQQEFDHIRAGADAALLLPKSNRPPAVGSLLIAAGGKFVDSINEFSERLSPEISQADPLIAEMMKIKQVAWVVRDAAGLDRLMVGSLIANGEGISSAQQLQFTALAGRMDAGWQVILEDARWLDLPPPLKDSIAKAQKLYFQDMRTRRKALLDDIATGKQAPISVVEWVNLTNTGVESIMKVANTAFDLSGAQASVLKSRATQEFVGAAIFTLFFFGFGIFAMIFVIRRVAQPMAEITAAMRAVADGDLEREAPYVDRQDEIGELGRTLDVFREKGRENRRLAAELVQQERLLALGQLTATVAHELRNPLSAIRNTVYTFRELGKGLNLERPIERIERSISRCDRIIGDLLDFTRVRELHKNNVSFDKWLDEVLNDQKLPPGIVLVRNLSAPGYVLNFDSDRMRQVVINLVDNAAQAMSAGDNPPGNGRVVVTTAARLNVFEMVIADNGPGISAENLARVFEPLFSTKSFGTGLGLPMVKQVIEQHNGKVDIASTPGRGTKITIRLPHTATQPAAAVAAA
jgi:signal transduction histidine kinase